ncbi:MAG: hypothetical protein Q7P63_16665 [Verrucomicrobiota bacterium JB022]|nr:hypothetical protein [Verrucomicrobiota bacterium JB022]
MARSRFSFSRLWRKQKTLILGAGAVVVLALALWAISALASGGVSSVSPQSAQREADPSAPGGANHTYTDIKPLIEAHYSAVGGRARLRELNSLRIVGTYFTADGTSFPLDVIKKNPFQLRIKIQRDNLDMVTGYDGESGWQAVMRDGQALRVSDVTGAEATALRQDADLHNLLYNYGIRGYSLSHPRLVDWKEGVPAYEVEVRDQNRALIKTYYLNRETLLELGNVQDRETQGKMVTYRVEYEDERPVDGLTLPHRVITYQDGQLYSRMEIESIAANVGILGDAFKKPDLAPYVKAKMEEMEAEKAAASTPKPAAP